MGSYTGQGHHEDPSSSNNLVLINEGNVFRIVSPHLPLSDGRQALSGSQVESFAEGVVSTATCKVCLCLSGLRACEIGDEGAWS